MSGKLEDDYWNTSSGFSFKFDDDGEFSKELMTTSSNIKNEPVFNSTLETYNLIPVHSLISRQNLNIVLDDVKMPIINASKSIESTINDMFLGQSCNLNNYRSLDQKISLLDKAIETNDGNIILKIVLFLTQTLKSNILYRFLSKKPLAFQQYANYLSDIKNIHSLELFYTATNNKNDLSNLFYISSQGTSNNSINLKLDQFIVEYLGCMNDYEKIIFTEYKKFLQIKHDKKIECDSVIMALTQLYIRKLTANESLTDSECNEFVKSLKISDFQNEWALLNAIASEGIWTKITDTFIKLNWFSKRNMIKSTINTELLVTSLHKHNVPNEVMKSFLSCMDDTDKSLYLAKKFKCHRFVIDTLISQKDRQSLMDYKKFIAPQTDDLFVIENALRAPDKKWIT